MKRKWIVAVIGGAECSDEEAQSAEQIGRGLAEHGCMLVCGGGSGVMEAACRGASGAGGFTIGILSGLDEDPSNPYLSLVVPTNLGGARNPLVVSTGQVVIAVGGSYGTLSEIGHALKLGREVIGLHTWKLESPAQQEGRIIHVESADEAVERAHLILKKKETRSYE